MNKTEERDRALKKLQEAFREIGATEFMCFWTTGKNDFKHHFYGQIPFINRSAITALLLASVGPEKFVKNDGDFCIATKEPI